MSTSSGSAWTRGAEEVGAGDVLSSSLLTAGGVGGGSGRKKETSVSFGTLPSSSSPPPPYHIMLGQRWRDGWMSIKHTPLSTPPPNPVILFRRFPALALILASRRSLRMRACSRARASAASAGETPSVMVFCCCLCSCLSKGTISVASLCLCMCFSRYCARAKKSVEGWIMERVGEKWTD